METWIDEFDNTTLIGSSQGVSVTGGKVQLTLNQLERQGLQIAGTSLLSPSIVRVGPSYYLYYSIFGPPGSILLATSSDANNWVGQGVVVAPGLAGVSDSYSVTYEDALLVGSTFHMWYSGMASGGYYAIITRGRPTGGAGLPTEL